MRKIFLICLLAISYFAQSQVPTALPTLYNGKLYEYTQYLAVDSGSFMPRRDTNFIPKQGGCIVFKTSDSTLYVSTGKTTGRKWKGIGSGGGSGVYNADYGLLLVSGAFKVDTLYITSRLRLMKSIDSLAALTQKQISVGYGLRFVTNNMYVDSFTVATRRRVQKAIDSVISVLTNGYLPLTGGTITGNLRVNSTLTSVASFIAQGDIQAQSLIRHNTDIRVLDKDESSYTAWVNRKGYYSNGVNLSQIGTASIDTITVAKSAVYTTNVGASFTNRSFTDKNYVDSSLNYRKVRIVGDSDVVINAVNDEIVFFRNITVPSRDITIPNPTLHKGKVFKFCVSDISVGSKRILIVIGGSDVLFLDGTVCTFISYKSTTELISDGTNWIVSIVYNQ